MAKSGSTGLILASVASMLLLAALDQTIVSTALPTIVADLGGLDHLSWVVTAYLLTSTIAGPLYGKLGDLYGRKLMMQIAVGLFLLGSVLAGLAQSMWFLIGARALQGLGGGGLFVLAFTVVGDVVAPRQRGKIQGIFGAVFGLSSVVGPLLGGFFVDALSWHWIFYINLPIGLGALAIFAAAFQATGKRKSHAIDWLGAALLSIALSCMVLLSSLSGQGYALSDPLMIGLAAASLIALALFIRVEFRAAEPILPMKLFTYNNFIVMGTVGFIIGAAMFGALIFLPFYLQAVKGVSPTMSGLQLVPMTLGILVGSMSSGQIMSRTGHYKWLPVIGSAVFCVGFLMLTRLRPDTSGWIVSSEMFIVGMGMGPSMSVGMTSIQNAVPPEIMGTGTAAFTTLRQIGGSIGVAVFGTLFTNGLRANLGDMPMGGGDMRSLGAETISRIPEPFRTKVLDAITGAMHPVFLAAAILAAISLVAGLFLREVPLREKTHEQMREAGEGAA